MKQISIQEVLANMSDESMMGQTFTLRFVRSTGKRRGTIATVAKARYGAPRHYAERSTPVQPASSDSGKRSYTKWLHTEHGTLPMTDVERNRYFTPLISHIIGYNDYQVIH